MITIQNAVIMFLLVLSYMINACADSVDHMKAGSRLMELWHILKAVSYGIPYSIILFLIHAPILLYPVFWLAIWIWWEFSYAIANAFEIYRYDDKLKIEWLRKLWGFHL